MNRQHRHLVERPQHEDGKPRRRRMFVVDNLDRYVMVESDCWIWQRHIDVYGYGQVTVNAVTLRAHRAIYELLVGRIPDGMALDHLCRDKRCCNPDHLEVVTNAENVRRSPLSISTINALRTHCPSGHPYDEANTSVNRRGWRRCKTCHRDDTRARYAALKYAT